MCEHTYAHACLCVRSCARVVCVCLRGRICVCVLSPFHGKIHRNTTHVGARPAVGVRLPRRGCDPGHLGEAAAAGGLPCAAQSGQVMAPCRASRDLGLVSGCRNHRSPGATGGRGRAHIASHFPKMSMFEHINITYNPGMIVQVLMEWFYGIDFQ